MTTENSQNEPERSAIDRMGSGTDRDQQAVIYPLVANSGNQRVLTEWIDDQDGYRIADTDQSLSAATFDLCIVDENGLKNHKEPLKQVKDEAAPVLLPVLLLLSETPTDVIDVDQGAIADSVYATTVDEILSMPIRQLELDWRIQALLRLRDQSSELNRFRRAVEASGHAIFVTDDEGTIEYVNPAFETITGYTAEDAIGETPALLDSGEMSAAFFDDFWNQISAGEIWEGELKNRRKDDEQYVARQTVAPIVDQHGDITAYVAVQTDITEQKKRQDRLKLYRDIVQRLDDPIMLQDRDGGFRLVNEALTRFAGLSEEELLGASEPSFMDGETAETINQQRETALRTETPVKYNVSPDFEHTGIDATFSTQRYPWYNDNGELVGTVAICRDVTTLEEQTRQLRVIDRIFRHNLRNSLTVVEGYAEEILSQTSGEPAEAAETILEYTDDLLTTSQKSRRITQALSDDPQPMPIDIGAVVQGIADSLRDTHPDAEIDLSVHNEQTVNAIPQIDDAIEELVTNGIVHNDQDEPSIELRVRSDSDAVRIDVIDDGPGINSMDRDVLESGRAIDDLRHGSGLGLWLTYWIVSRSNGSIAVEDVDPRGTRVTIQLPLQTTRME